MSPVWNRVFVGAVTASTFALGTAAIVAQLNSGEPQILSNRQRITSLAPRGSTFQPLNPHLADAPEYTVGQAVSTAISPNGKTLLALTSGYHLWN